MCVEENVPKLKALMFKSIRKQNQEQQQSGTSNARNQTDRPQASNQIIIWRYTLPLIYESFWGVEAGEKG
jgi:hypothetical protein